MFCISWNHWLYNGLNAAPYRFTSLPVKLGLCIPFDSVGLPHEVLFPSCKKGCRNHHCIWWPSTFNHKGCSGSQHGDLHLPGFVIYFCNSSLLPYWGLSTITEGQDLNTTVNEVWALCHEPSIHQRDADTTEVGNQAQFRHLQEAKVREPRDRGSGLNLSLTLGNDYDFYRPVIPVL